MTLQPLLQIARGDAEFPNWKRTAGGCAGDNGYDDLRLNAGVTLYAANGDVAGSGFITDATVAGSKCILTGTVDDVTPAKFFKVQFANRNKVAFSMEQLQEQSAYLTIGQ